MSDTTNRNHLIWLAPEWQGTTIYNHPQIRTTLPETLQNQLRATSQPILRPSDFVLDRIEPSILNLSPNTPTDFITTLADLFYWALARLPLSETDQNICITNNPNLITQLTWLNQYAPTYLNADQK